MNHGEGNSWDGFLAWSDHEGWTKHGGVGKGVDCAELFSGRDRGFQLGEELGRASGGERV